MPFFSTDTVSAQRALEIKCDAVLMSKSGVDGSIDERPRTTRGLASSTGDLSGGSPARPQGCRRRRVQPCMDNGLDMIVFGMEGEGSITRAVRGERIGTPRHCRLKPSGAQVTLCAGARLPARHTNETESMMIEETYSRPS